MFVVGRIKDLLFIRGGNHYPEDFVASVQQIPAGRTAAIAVRLSDTEQLVTVIEIKLRGDSGQEATDQLDRIKSDVTSAISTEHGLNVADLVLVAPGEIPTTTSGKVRRAACVAQYGKDQFTRLDA
jgi:fatty acid CoA ligase FadD21